MDEIHLHWRNASADVVGEKHGVSDRDFKNITPAIEKIHRQIQSDRKAGLLKFRDLPRDEEMLQAIEKQVEHFRDRCDVLIVLGIGGSALGNIALQQALNPWTYNLLSDRVRTGPQVFVLDNVDPDQIKSVVDLITPKLKRTIVNVISKSGETAETAAQFILFRDLLMQKLGKKHGENILCTTDPSEGTLQKVASENGYRTLVVPPGVGGRFSILSAVGLFSAAMCGIDIDAILKGANAMDKRLSKPNIEDNPAAMLAALHYTLDGKGKHIAVMMPYSTSLYGLADWFRQLWAESLGKKGKGQTPIKALGTTDQHSQIQLYREGPNDKLIAFLEVDRFGTKLGIPNSLRDVESIKYLAGSNLQSLIHAEKKGTEYALIQSQRPNITVNFAKISPETVGQFIYLYESAVSYIGGLYEINPYDQPAVELGKQATFALMGKAGFADLMKAIDAKVK
jgi:glucose-6-phosphate isomerase